MIQYTQVDSPMSPQSLLSVVRKRVKLILTLFLLLFLAVVAGTFLMSPIYRAQAKVMVSYLLDNNTAHLLDLYMVQDNSYYDRLNSELVIFKMRSILEPVVTELGLADAEGRQSPAFREKAIEKLAAHVQVERERDTNVLVVSCDNNDPELAAEIIDRVVSNYIEQRPTLFRDERIYRFLDEQIENIWAQIDAIKMQGMEYQQREKVISPDRQSEILFTSIAGFDQELTKVRSERISREANLQIIKEQLQSGEEVAIPTIQSSESWSRYDYVNRLKTRLLELELEKNRLLQKYTEKHPEVLQVISEIAETKKKRDSEVQEIMAAEEASIKAMRAAEGSLASRMNQVVDSIAKLSRQQYELGKITIGIEDLEKVHSMLLRQREEARISQGKQEHLVQVRMLEPAMIPSKPVRPIVPLYIGLGFLLALVVSLGTAFFVEYFDHSVNSVEDAHYCLGLPILAAIPEFPDWQQSVGTASTSKRTDTNR
ncbi:hypothetical protein JW992_14770 [candidate division KSB1 bacterium]|nr:hypothetical protein [candidate division KSB1 bacterium]